MRDLTVTFAGVRALSEVSFQVAGGSTAGIIGPNGAGKSTLLNVVSGVYRATSGSVEVFGTRLTGQPRQGAQLGAGRTFQNIALFKGMSVLDNLVAGQRLHRGSTLLEQALGLPRARREARAQIERAEQVMALLHLERHAHTRVGTLAYGLQKRVELGRALVARPKLLLLDEPMAGMNAGEKAEMAAFIREAKRAHGATIVLIEHDLGVVMELVDQLVVLDYGQLIADGAPAEVASSERVVTAYLGAAAEDGAWAGGPSAPAAGAASTSAAAASLSIPVEAT